MLNPVNMLFAFCYLLFHEFYESFLFIVHEIIFLLFCSIVKMLFLVVFQLFIFSKFESSSMNFSEFNGTLRLNFLKAWLQNAKF